MHRQRAFHAADKDAKESRNKRIFDLWMQCYTQEEIAEICGCVQPTVVNVIDDFIKNGKLAEIDKNPAANHLTDFEPPIYNVWKQPIRARVVKANVVTDVTSLVTTTSMCNGDEAQKLVTFSEGILRLIIPLKPEQQVKLVKQLAAISKDVWEIIGATISAFAPNSESNGAPSFGATAPFTEGLLRSIIPLKAEQQVFAIVTGIIDGDPRARG